MKGTIEFKLDGLKIEIRGKTMQLHKLEKLMLIDAMARALELDKEEQVVCGMTVMLGGIDKVLGNHCIEETRIDVSQIEKFLKQKGKQEDETDSH